MDMVGVDLFMGFKWLGHESVSTSSFSAEVKIRAAINIPFPVRFV
jgi:hypothetical protein